MRRIVGITYTAARDKMTRGAIHSGAAVATLLVRNQKNTTSPIEPQNTESTALSFVSK